MKYSPGIIGVLKHVFLFAFVCNVSMAQEQEVVLPSPETAALFRYQEYPMDYSTGLPQISIPLFTVKNGSLSVPISISYHASGFKVTDTDGPIAAGWSLNVGGMVSRTIHGDPDFGEFPFPDAFDPYLSTPGQNTLQILEQVTHYPDNPELVETGQFRDSEYDIFSYSFGNHSGKFIFNDSAGIKTPVILNQKPLKIYPTTVSTGLNSLRITDDRGDNYTFVGQESQTTNTLNHVGFALKKILSANQKDSIVYTYGGLGQQFRKYVSQYEILEDEWHTAPDPGANINGQVTENPTEQYYDIHRITEIDFEQGTLEFVLIGGIGQDNTMIDYIQLKDRNSKVIKKIKFNRNPLHVIGAALGTTNLQTHKLTGIEIEDQNGNVVENYAFDYYPTIYAAQDTADEIIDSRFVDLWGYYNASGETNMIPATTVQSGFIGGSNPGDLVIGNPWANRSPNLLGKTSGVLKKVYYQQGVAQNLSLNITNI